MLVGTQNNTLAIKLCPVSVLCVYSCGVVSVPSIISKHKENFPLRGVQYKYLSVKTDLPAFQIVRSEPWEVCVTWVCRDLVELAKQCVEMLEILHVHHVCAINNDKFDRRKEVRRALFWISGCCYHVDPDWRSNNYICGVGHLNREIESAWNQNSNMFCTNLKSKTQCKVWVNGDRGPFQRESSRRRFHGKSADDRLVWARFRQPQRHQDRQIHWRAFACYRPNAKPKVQNKN